jgi:hypothetical protein
LFSGNGSSPEKVDPGGLPLHILSDIQVFSGFGVFAGWGQILQKLGTAGLAASVSSYPLRAVAGEN